jgi:hypothetical protein
MVPLAHRQLASRASSLANLLCSTWLFGLISHDLHSGRPIVSTARSKPLTRSRWHMNLVMSACDIAETIDGQFHLDFGSFVASTGCRAGTTLVCKLPLKCHLGQS